MIRRATIARAALVGVMSAALFLTACSAKKSDEPAVSSPATSESTVTPLPVRIGTLATEDSLPLWIAQERGYFSVERLPGVEIVSFQSAQERDTAFASGAIDAFMGDIVAAANLEAGGAPGTIVTVMLGADQSQGRFGIVAPKGWTGGTGDKGVAVLAGVPVGTSSATIQEYVLDGLMAQAGVKPADIKVEEVKKVPVRFELLMAGKLKAAMLPEPFLTLAEQGGAVLVAEDTATKANLSQTVLYFSDAFLAKTGGPEAADAVLGAWDAAVSEINVNPEAYRTTLVDKARLPQPLANSYKVNTYPQAQLPTKKQVGDVLKWMKDKGYLKGDVDYDALTTRP